MKKIVIIIVCIYFSFGFIVASYFYAEDLKTFDCVNPEFGTGGFFANPNPELCTRRGFTLRSLTNIPIFTVLGVPMAIKKYYAGKIYTKDILINQDELQKELNTTEVESNLSTSVIDNNEIQKWGNYTSEKLKISFRYPQNYIVVETSSPNMSSIGTSTYIVLMKNTSYNKQYAKTINSDFDYNIPDGQENIDIEPGQSISLSRSISSIFVKDITKWFKENMAGKYADRISYSQAYFMGMSSVAYRAEGLFMIDGVLFEKGGYLYQFSVQYYNSPESPRNDFYKIVSTLKFN